MTSKSRCATTLTLGNAKLNIEFAFSVTETLGKPNSFNFASKLGQGLERSLTWYSRARQQNHIHQCYIARLLIGRAFIAVVSYERGANLELQSYQRFLHRESYIQNCYSRKMINWVTSSLVLRRALASEARLRKCVIRISSQCTTSEILKKWETRNTGCKANSTYFTNPCDSD